MRGVRVAQIAFAVVMAGPCAAQGDVRGESAQTVEVTVDSARVAVRSASEWLASGVDSWFGNKPFSEGGKVSDGQIGLNLYKRQDQGTDASVRFNARFKLPNVDEHTYLFTGRDNSAGVITDQPAVFATKQQLLQPDTAADRSYFAGFGRALGDSVDARVGFQGGLKPFAQGRFRRLWTPAADEELELSQTVFVTIADHLGSSTALSYEHRYAPTWVGRWLNVVTATQADPQLAWNGSLGLYKSMGPQRLLSMEILASSKQGTGLGLSDYGVQLRWSQPVHHDWLIGEIIFGHFWPQSLVATDRSTAWALGAGLTMKF